MANRIVCLTPIKNEGWVLDLFLKAASAWADNIIVADQFSTDNSRLICKKYPKVIQVENKYQLFSESVRQKLLIREARRLTGIKTFVALDADEFMTPNLSDEEWQLFKISPKKTVFFFKMHNIQPEFEHYWTFNKVFPLATVDDGTTKLLSRPIHNNRLPFDDNWNKIQLNNLSILHLQYVDPKRNRSKMRWYQCYERLKSPKRHPIDLYRQYMHDLIRTNKQILPIPTFWLEGYKQLGVNFSNVKYLKTFWWDKEVQRWVDRYGASKFCWLDIWFDSLASKHNVSIVELALFLYLRHTQKYYPKYNIDHLDNFLKKQIKP